MISAEKRELTRKFSLVAILIITVYDLWAVLSRDAWSISRWVMETSEDHTGLALWIGCNVSFILGHLIWYQTKVVVKEVVREVVRDSNSL